jgi:hypothetical protein
MGYTERGQNEGAGWHTAVESKSLGVLLGLLGRGIAVGVLDARLLAARRGEHGVQGVDEEGGRGGEEDIAAGVSILSFMVDA